uniref:Uncharacterized protein n=2 Tax=Guillardia theta TaxID=55529 RepID=A0A7S4LZY2_GUITH|mmetsp:Transcript_11810/g.40714  ORF Transcript_11810/g.40714 Transcript_11810/m.40714 type:complete len:128 (+) Transcript_11810:240-623(+)
MLASNGSITADNYDVEVVQKSYGQGHETMCRIHREKKSPTERSADVDDPIVYNILYCSELNHTLFVSFPAASSHNVFRTFDLEDEKLCPRRWAAGDKMKCKRVTTALPFLYRLHSLHSIDKLLPEMR